MDEKALYKITYGLYVVSAQAEGQRSGCVVNTLQQVTAEPVRLAVTVNKLGALPLWPWISGRI